MTDELYDENGLHYHGINACSQYGVLEFMGTDRRGIPLGKIHYDKPYNGEWQSEDMPRKKIFEVRFTYFLF